MAPVASSHRVALGPGPLLLAPWEQWEADRRARAVAAAPTSVVGLVELTGASVPQAVERVTGAAASEATAAGPGGGWALGVVGGAGDVVLAAVDAGAGLAV